MARVRPLRCFCSHHVLLDVCLPSNPTNFVPRVLRAWVELIAAFFANLPERKIFIFDGHGCRVSRMPQVRTLPPAARLLATASVILRGCSFGLNSCAQMHTICSLTAVISLVFYVRMMFQQQSSQGRGYIYLSVCMRAIFRSSLSLGMSLIFVLDESSICNAVANDEPPPTACISPIYNYIVKYIRVHLV